MGGSVVSFSLTFPLPLVSHFPLPSVVSLSRAPPSPSIAPSTLLSSYANSMMSLDLEESSLERSLRVQVRLKRGAIVEKTRVSLASGHNIFLAVSLQDFVAESPSSKERALRNTAPIKTKKGRRERRQRGKREQRRMLVLVFLFSSNEVASDGHRAPVPSFLLTTSSPSISLPLFLCSLSLSLSPLSPLFFLSLFLSLPLFLFLFSPFFKPRTTLSPTPGGLRGRARVLALALALRV